MDSTPVRIVSGTNEEFPSDPVRIVNWNEFIAAVVAAVGSNLVVPLSIGTPPNYTGFEADGTMVAHGLATCYRDELQSVTSSRLTSPSGDFELDDVESSVRAEASARYPTDYISMNIQLNHDWSLGTAISPHLHWWQTVNRIPNWLIAHRWQKQGGLKTTSWSNVKWASNAFTYSSGTLNQITLFGDIAAPVGYGQVSDIIQIRLYRDVLNATLLFGGAENTPVDQSLVNLDIHLKVDTLGSRQEYIK